MILALGSNNFMDGPCENGNAAEAVRQSAWRTHRVDKLVDDITFM